MGFRILLVRTEMSGRCACVGIGCNQFERFVLMHPRAGSARSQPDFMHVQRLKPYFARADCVKHFWPRFFDREWRPLVTKQEQS
jgi:hypothetical protein